MIARTEKQTYIESTIARKPVTISGNDATTQVGADLAALSYTVSGLVEGETLTGVAVSTDAKKDAAGEYKVTVTVNGENPNYEITTREGKYTVSTDAFVVVAKDKYGVFSDEATYAGFNIELTVPQGATAYYSTIKPLTKDNYQVDGMTALKNQPSTAGTHTVYFYVTDGTNAVSGSKQVIIDKAAQTAPDAFKDCTTLRQVLILSADTKFTPTAFDGCNDVYIFAPDGSLASYLCTQENGFVFVETFR